MERKGFTRRTALVAPLALTVFAAIPASAAGRSNRQLLQAFLETLSAHDLTAFRALYVDDGYVQHQTLTQCSTFRDTDRRPMRLPHYTKIGTLCNDY